MQTLLTNIEQLVSKTDKKLQETTFPKIIENLSDLILEIQKSQNVSSLILLTPLVRNLPTVQGLSKSP